MMVYGVYHNTEPTEGRGLMALVDLFVDEDDAKAYVAVQPDYPGHPMWEVRPLNVRPKGFRLKPKRLTVDIRPGDNWQLENIQQQIAAGITCGDGWEVEEL